MFAREESGRRARGGGREEGEGGESMLVFFAVVSCALIFDRVLSLLSLVLQYELFGGERTYMYFCMYPGLLLLLFFSSVKFSLLV